MDAGSTLDCPGGAAASGTHDARAAGAQRAQHGGAAAQRPLPLSPGGPAATELPGLAQQLLAPRSDLEPSLAPAAVQAAGAASLNAAPPLPPSPAGAPCAAECAAAQDAATATAPPLPPSATVIGLREQDAAASTVPPPSPPAAGPAPGRREAWQDYSSVFTAAKAGMEGVDKDKVKRVVFEMSKVWRG